MGPCSLFEDVILAFQHRIVDEHIRQMLFCDVLRIFKEQKLLGLVAGLQHLDEAFLKAYDEVIHTDL